MKRLHRAGVQRVVQDALLILWMESEGHNPEGRREAFPASPPPSLLVFPTGLWPRIFLLNWLLRATVGIAGQGLPTTAAASLLVPVGPSLIPPTFLLSLLLV